MRLAWAKALLLVGLMVGSARAQAPTGIIAGVVTDASGGALAAVQVAIVNRNTGQTRAVATSAAGHYSAPALPPGGYRVAAQAAHFKRVEREATVEAGTTTTVDLMLEVGEVTETVTVSGAIPTLRHDEHQVAGVVTRPQIENLPLNGRNFLELAKLEPGVTNPIRGSNNNRTFVAALGSGLQTIPRIGYTRVTVDGASIGALGAIGAALQVSHEVVQEFQIATVNFDLATSLTTNGAINIVTRSGGNALYATAFTFYRDHHLAAYPALRRDPRNPDPFFRRHQFGGSAGGPVRRGRAFFFASYERNDQRGVVSVQPAAPELAPLGGIFASPARGNLFTARGDVRLHPDHQTFFRHTHDDSRAFFSGGVSVLPSGWSRRTTSVDQSVGALTSVLGGNLVSELRFSYFSSDTPERPAGSDDCPGCFGLAAPRISIPDIGLVFGTARTLAFVGRRYQLYEQVTWQRGDQRVRVGFDWEHATYSDSAIDREPAQIALWSPGRALQSIPTLSLPASFATIEDFLRLPLRDVETAVGSGSVLWRGFGDARVFDLVRLYASDTWRVTPRVTVNGGLAWSYEPNALNHDLVKPALLIPILGPAGLRSPRVRSTNFSPSLGFAWTATRDAKTIVRGGAGRYFDPAASTNSVNLANERHALSPVGTGRLIASNIVWNGRPLVFPQPTSFTGADLMAILPEIRAALQRSLNSGNRDYSVRNIEGTKQATNLYDPDYQTPSAIHVNLGVQRELARGFVAGADLVWRRFVHTFINGIDYNRYFSREGPVIPHCTTEESTDVTAVCSNGSFMFDTTIGRARYVGLLMRIEKRLSGRGQFTASYALGSYVGTNGTGTGTVEAAGGRVFGFNNDDWFENYGPLPTDQRHVLNVSGFIDLPWRFQMAFSVAAYSRPPFSAYVAGVDFNGDGTRNDLLPGTKVNQFGRGLDKDDLVWLIDRYNAQFAGRRTAGGQTAPPLTLPAHFSFDDNFFTQDLRLARSFSLGRKRARLLLLVEVFNLLNTANLVDYRSNLADQATFGQPGARFTQVFGSGGPRAAQLGARISF